ncbi:MAG: flippase [Gemmatimonadaceae bacterium]|nr:flippase [Gemmatimonadaceae bacterium]
MSVPVAENESVERGAPTGAAGGLDADLKVATKSALQLGGGLLGSWVIGLGIRLALPRFLGPEQFGILQFADVFTTTVLIVTTLGADTYIRKEVVTRPAHASEFFGGTLFLGVCLAALVLGIALPSLAAAGKPPLVLWMVLWMGLAQLVINANKLYAALLHAVGAVGGLATLNVASKLLWAGGIALALSSGAGLIGVAQAMLLSELVRLIVIARLGRQHVDLSLRKNVDATLKMLRASFPFFLAAVAQTVYARIDVSILSFMANDTEVGWYGAAATIAGLSLLLSPIIAWVLLPLSSRAAARSEEELVQVMRQAMAFVLLLAIPSSLAIWVSADVLILTAFGTAFEPAVHSLRILAPTFLLTYLAMVSASLLVRLERAWMLTSISLAGMVISPMLSLLLVPRFAARFGAGGAGMGAAWALTLTECFIAGSMTWQLRSRAFDRRSVALIGKTLALGLSVAIMDMAIRPLGVWRLPLDAIAYVGVGLLIGVIDVAMLRRVARTVRSRPPEVAAS